MGCLPGGEAWSLEGGLPWALRVHKKPAGAHGFSESLCPDESSLWGRREGKADFGKSHVIS